MSTAAMQSTSQRTQAPASSGSYAPASTNRQYPPSSQNQEAYYANQGTYAPTSNQPARRQGRHNGQSASTSSPTSQQQYYSSPHANTSGLNTPYTQALPLSNNASPHGSASAIGGHGRSRSLAADQYDGPPIPPPRTSSQQQRSSPPLPTALANSPAGRGATTQHTRQNTLDERNYGGREQNYGEDYDEPVRERPRENTATAAAVAAQIRRKAAPTSEMPQASSNTRQHEEQSDYATQSQSEGMTGGSSAPAPLIRENSEVINRVIVSDPQVDAERLQERVAEARPAPIGNDVTPVTGLGLVGSEGVEDGGRGGARRQDYSRSSSRRKDVQFGDYMLGQTLGEGEFGKVKLGWKKDGSTQVAIKLIRRESVATNPSRLPKIYREISILRDLAHPNIVRLHEMVETERHIGIILEYASGGELFDYILNHRYLKDQAARRLFAQLVSGVGYLHKKGIVHRDLKLENLLLDQNRNIIITDFGFANTFNPDDELSDEIAYNLSNRDFVRKYRLDRQDEKGMRKGDLMQTSCGSPCYAAPELVVSDSLYTGKKVDVWSCGVILYAMLAGYLPFDDDPANPEGDNINLLYKYITSTPLTFPEYVTPHARDLLRRILVPDPRKRADLFEVARHSWLSEYHHVVSHITSSTTNIADIQNSTVSHEEQRATPILNRSASVREPTKTPSNASPLGALSHQQGKLAQNDDVESSRSRDRANRHTLQPEYVAPQSHTIRGEESPSAISGNHQQTARGTGQRNVSSQSTSYSKPLPQDPPMESGKVADFPITPASQQKMPPPTRPARDVPRSTSDSTGAFGVPTSQSAQQNTAYQQVTRPSTGGSLTSGTGPGGTRSDIRLPSRGSYGQPVAPTVAATNVQGRVTQPTNGRGSYSISAPIHQPSPQSSGQPVGQPLPSRYNETPAAPPAPPTKGHHRRTSTLSGLGERLFGRSASISKRPDAESARQKNGKKYPPTSMKDAYPTDNTRRQSIESKRSFSFGLGKKKSVDLDSQAEKPTRRFSLLPASMSFKGLMGGAKEEDTDPESPIPQPGDFPQPPTGRGQSRPTTEQGRMNSYDAERSAPTGHDGQYDQQPQPPQVNNFSRPPQHQQRSSQAQNDRYGGNSSGQHQQRLSQAPNDVYGGTGVYAPTSQYLQQQERSYGAEPTPSVESQHRHINQGQPRYPEGFDSYDQPRPSMQQGRQGKSAVLQKNNRKFVDQYNNEQGPTHHEGSSGPAKKVMDFFRRRGRARTDGYRPGDSA